MLDLHGLRVINTRPSVRAEALTQALKEAGAEVLSLPLLETIALSPDEYIKDCVLNLDSYDAVFVASPTAAQLGMSLLADYWPQWPVNMQWFAVGQATADVLRSYGLEPIVPAQETSEGLLQLNALQQLAQGARLLVLRGEGGRNLVRDSLQQQGVKVDYINLYRRQLPQNSQQHWLSIRSQQPHVVILSSGETLNHWCELALEQAKTMIALVVSPRLAHLATQKGIQTVLVADSMKPKDIILTLNQWRNSSRHGID